MQLTRHISTAVWSSADKVLYLSLGLVFLIPQKVIGEAPWGLFAASQAFLTVIFMLADGFALQIMVNFGVVEERRPQATSAALLLYTLFIGLGTLGVWLGREEIAALTRKPELADVLALFPLLAAGFFLRNFTLKIAQLKIDTRGTFIIDAAWAVATIGLLVFGWQTGSLVDELDMVVIAAAAAGISSVVGLLLYGRGIRLARRFAPGEFKQMIRFGMAQFGSATTMGFLSQGDVLLLTALVGDAAVVGNYDVAKKFFRGFEGIRDAGALFVYPAVARLSSQKRFEEIRTLVEKMTMFTAIIIVPIVLLLWLLPIEKAFELVYKGNYQSAPDILRILSLAALAIPLSMHSYVLLGMSRVRRLFTASASAAVASVILALILVPGLEGKGQALAVVGSFWTLGIVAFTFVSRQTGIGLGDIWRRRRDAHRFVGTLRDLVRERVSGTQKKNGSEESDEQ